MNKFVLHHMIELHGPPKKSRIPPTSKKYSLQRYFNTKGGIEAWRFLMLVNTKYRAMMI